jgi:2-oxoglutarate/2-oxoacid ferredoxin oxidoreductase subunit beta
MATKELLPVKLKAFQLKSDKNPDWCPGCGDFGIVNAVQQAISELQLKPWDVTFFSGVGCSGKSSQYAQVYGIHTLHGRVLPYALGAKMVNPHLTVIAAGGDGDGYGIGGNHFIHAGRRNVDITYIVFNNEVYGLTKGQAAPTLEVGLQPKSLPLPNISQGINPLAMAVTCGYTFVARSYSFDAKHLKDTIMAAINHRGVSIVDVYQPCPTYNDLHPKEYYSEKVLDNGTEMPRVYYLTDTDYDPKVHNPADVEEVARKKSSAIQRAYEIEARIPLGVYYSIELPTYEDRLQDNFPLLKGSSPIDLPYHDADMNPTTDLSSALEEFVV